MEEIVLHNHNELLFLLIPSTRYCSLNQLNQMRQAIGCLAWTITACIIGFVLLMVVGTCMSVQQQREREEQQAEEQLERRQQQIQQQQRAIPAPKKSTKLKQSKPIRNEH
jgi:ammonia channel protein AmtB